MGENDFFYALIGHLPPFQTPSFRIISHSTPQSRIPKSLKTFEEKY
jgi:hypothetical protein